MKDELIKLANSKGFVTPCLPRGYISVAASEQLDHYFWMCELHKWLRDEYGIYIEIDLMIYEGFFKAFILEHDVLGNDGDLYTYEQALEVGLIEALKLIK